MKKYIIMIMMIFVIGCTLTPQQKIAIYDCYWGCPNELGETGWCCRNKVPENDQDFFDCHNATPDRVVKGATCPQ